MQVISVIYGGGAARMTFDLTSECINGERAKVSVLAGGFAVGFGTSMGGTRSSIKFEDNRNDIDHNVFNGRAKFVAGGIAIGPENKAPILPPGSVGGGGYGASAIQLGETVSIGHGSQFGLDFSISAGAGVSTVRDVTYESCACE
jgi:hypothetical protein